MAGMLSESFRMVRGNSMVRNAITCEQSGRKESGQIHNKQECHELINPDRNSPVIGKFVEPQYKTDDPDTYAGDRTERPENIR
ncbi:hypothetical protein B5F86_12480 [Lachnoclostridium sp. An298]|nr:hypothetical protein B5F86_12480 [Lachnoclostridium sp. An298]